MLLCDGRLVAKADLHPEFTSFHSGTVPSSVVAGFLTSIVDGCDSVNTPLGRTLLCVLRRGTLLRRLSP